MLSLGKIAWDIFSPSSCVACGDSISHTLGGICKSCLGSINICFTDENLCKICSHPLNDDFCSYCDERHISYDASMVILQYDDLVRSIFHSIKFERQSFLLKTLYKYLGSQIVSQLQDEPFDLVSFVPMNRKKRWQRGFNQSEIFAKLVAKGLGIPVKSTMSEAGHSGTQREQSYSGRFLNIIGRYVGNSKIDISDRSILLVDDVFTTGATINECSRVLKGMGAKKIFVLAIARPTIKKSLDII